MKIRLLAQPEFNPNFIAKPISHCFCIWNKTIIKPKAKGSFIVLQNCLLHNRPSTHKQLKNYLSISQLPSSPSEEEPSDLSSKEWMYKLKSLPESNRKKFLFEMQSENALIKETQKEYDRVVSGMLKLPLYWNMLLADCEFIDVNIYFGKGLEKHRDGLKPFSIVSNDQLEKSLEPKELHTKLSLIHPFIKEKVYRKYKEIHHNFSFYNPKFREIGIFLPILYFSHPYELYLIDEHKKKCFSQETESSLKQEILSEFDEKWNDLHTMVRKEYEKKAENFIREYNFELGKVVDWSGLSKAKIERLALAQFSRENERIKTEILNNEK